MTVIEETTSQGGSRMVLIRRPGRNVYLDQAELAALKAHLADEVLAENRHRLVFEK